jgi:hypothetical protein
MCFSLETGDIALWWLGWLSGYTSVSVCLFLQLVVKALSHSLPLLKPHAYGYLKIHASIQNTHRRFWSTFHPKWQIAYYTGKHLDCIILLEALFFFELINTNAFCNYIGFQYHKIQQPKSTSNEWIKSSQLHSWQPLTAAPSFSYTLRENFLLVLVYLQ